MLEDSDINKIADLIRKHRTMNRWYNDPERAKRYGPVTESLCWILGIIAVMSIVVASAVVSGTDYNKNSNQDFINTALSMMDCDSLRGISYALLKDGEQQGYYDNNRNLIDSQILTRCT